ncbi:zf-HC2 domain-containing protein [Promicromonospora sukumoe]
MTTTGDLRIDDWVVHRPNVVRSVAARVPGVDAEEATSRALEKMVRIVSTGGTIDDPAPYWRRAAVNEAISMTREAGRARPVEDDTLDGLTPPVQGAELDAEREADVSMLRSALSDLADDDRKILLDRHVHDMAVTDIAGDLGVRPHAVTMRLRRAEERLAGAFAAAHAQAVNEPECRTTRAAMHDYLKGRLLPRRQRRLEVHMDGCTECTRAFIDVREVSWMLRDLGQHLIAGGLLSTGAAAGAAGAAGAAKPRSFGKKETAVAAGVLAALAIGGGAAALIVNQLGDPPIQAVEEAGAAGDGSGAGGGAGAGAGDGGSGDAADSPSTSEEPPADEKPPSIPPADPQPRPATTPKEDGTATPADTAPVVAEPAPAPDTEAPSGSGGSTGGSGPDSGSGSNPGGGSDTPEEPEQPQQPEEPPTDPEPPVEPPEVPEEPPATTPGVGTALSELLASLGLTDLPGIDLATTTLDEIWELLFGTFSSAADDTAPATGD